MAINISDFNKIWASTSPLTPYSFSDANYKNGWNFVGATPPARQMWDAYMKASDEKHQWLYNNKLSLSGGTMTGGLTASSIAFIPSFSPNIYVNQDYSDLKMYGGTAVHKGGDLQLFGKDSSLYPGYFRLAADDGTNRKQLIGTPGGGLTWDNNNVALAKDVLSLAGGTMTGLIRFDVSVGRIQKTDNTGSMLLAGSNSVNDGAYLTLYGGGASNNAGYFYLVAQDGTNAASLTGRPDGALFWNSNAILTAANYSSYALPLTGGTMTGNAIINFAYQWGGINSAYENDAGSITIRGGSGDGKGARFRVSGRNRTNCEGVFELAANDGTNDKVLKGNPNGTLTWDGQPIQTSSDKRLKQSFSDVPASVLEAWGKVEWKRFKYRADAERKGAKNCRWHTGLVAQDVQKVGEENNVDLLKYGILCHDVREATEDSEAVDVWTVRYEEALAMEVVYLRREIAKLHEEVKALRAE